MDGELEKYSFLLIDALSTVLDKYTLLHLFLFNFDNNSLPYQHSKQKRRIIWNRISYSHCWITAWLRRRVKSTPILVRIRNCGEFLLFAVVSYVFRFSNRTEPCARVSLSILCWSFYLKSVQRRLTKNLSIQFMADY